MVAARESAVLFAELLGAAELFARAGDAAAHEAITHCAGRLEQAAGRDARLVKTMGSRLMLLAPGADAAACAAAAMQAAADDFESLTLGVGFHYGPVIQENDDVFGDTVNLAARLVEQTAKGQILLAAETAAALSSPYSRWVRHLYSMPLKGRKEEVALCELVWRADKTAATVLPFGAAAKPSRAKLTLKYRETRLVLLNGAEALTIGREDDCGLVLADSTASRHHCSIHRRNDHFVLVDRSTNGTYVTVEGDHELLLRHDELMLRKRGWISFGIPRGAGAEAAEFFCD
jgi:class 3 adenylate cyclase